MRLGWDRLLTSDSEVRHEVRDKANVVVRVGSDFSNRRGFPRDVWREFYL